MSYTIPTVWEYKRDDRRPQLTHTLRDDDSNRIDVSGANEVRLVVEHTKEDAPRVNTPVSIDNAPEGEVSYQWQANDLGRSGEYLAEFVIIWNGGKQTVPDQGYYYISVDEALGYNDDPLEYDGRENVTVGYLDAASVSVGSLSASDGETINLNGARFSGSGTPQTASELTPKGYVDDLLGESGAIDGLTNPLIEALDANGYPLERVGELDLASQDLTNVKISEGAIRRHDGSGEMPAGLYVEWDNRWHSIGEGKSYGALVEDYEDLADLGEYTAVDGTAWRMHDGNPIMGTWSLNYPEIDGLLLAPPSTGLIERPSELPISVSSVYRQNGDGSQAAGRFGIYTETEPYRRWHLSVNNVNGTFDLVRAEGSGEHPLDITYTRLDTADPADAPFITETPEGGGDVYDLDLTVTEADTDGYVDITADVYRWDPATRSRTGGSIAQLSATDELTAPIGGLTFEVRAGTSNGAHRWDDIRTQTLPPSGIADHDHGGDTLTPGELVIGDPDPDPADYPIAALTLAGVTFWVGNEEPEEMEPTDVFIDVSQQ